MNKKVTKNRCFLSKTADFLAGGNNSEPWIYKSLAPQRLQNSVPSLA